MIKEIKLIVLVQMIKIVKTIVKSYKEEREGNNEIYDESKSKDYQNIIERDKKH